MQRHLLLSDLYQSLDRLTVLEKIDTLLESALTVYPTSIELHEFKFKLFINDPQKQEVEAISILDGFKRDRSYGSAIVQLLKIIEDRNVSGT